MGWNCKVNARTLLSYNKLNVASELHRTEFQTHITCRYHFFFHTKLQVCMPVMYLTLNPNPILCSIGLDQHNYLVYAWYVIIFKRGLAICFP